MLPGGRRAPFLRAAQARPGGPLGNPRGAWQATSTARVSGRKDLASTTRRFVSCLWGVCSAGEAGSRDRWVVKSGRRERPLLDNLLLMAFVNNPVRR